MGTVKFEYMKETAEGCKIYFTSYLRKDFVEKSVVITLRTDFTVSGIYISSYNFGSLEWINGKGLSECRKWETDEQAESPGYLTRRYTARISNGLMSGDDAENLLIPDVINSMENSEITAILKSLMKVKKSKKKITPSDFGFTVS